MNIIKTDSVKSAETCFVAVRLTDEADPVIYGVFLDKQQALAEAALQEGREESDHIRNLSTYGVVQTVLQYPRGAETVRG